MRGPGPKSLRKFQEPELMGAADRVPAPDLASATRQASHLCSLAPGASCPMLSFAKFCAPPNSYRTSASGTFSPKKRACVRGTRL
jgi:hypothetical protein